MFEEGQKPRFAQTHVYNMYNANFRDRPLKVRPRQEELMEAMLCLAQTTALDFF
jgi:hypothetical protein